MTIRLNPARTVRVTSVPISTKGMCGTACLDHKKDIQWLLCAHQSLVLKC